MADISYTRTTWADGSEGGTPIDAAKLNNIEQGIVDAVAAIGPNDTTEDGTLKAQISDLQDSVYKDTYSIALSGSVCSTNATGLKVIIPANIPMYANSVSVSVVNSNLELRKDGATTTRTISSALFNDSTKCIEATLSSAINAATVYGMAGSAELSVTISY